MKFIIGLGNPDAKYAKTRHNTGYMILTGLGAKHAAAWQTKAKFQAECAQIELDGIPVLLLKPTTYYNDSGLSVRKVKDFYNIDNADILVIHDELVLPFGTIRVRPSGGDAGNNGIKSVTAHIGEDYARVRVGIGHDERQPEDDIDFVLSAFTKAETATLPHIFDAIEPLIHEFIASRLEPLSHTVI
jgi:PTH1 family peptidyl-tRNA hydrolase